METVEARLIRGHGVASGSSQEDRRFPHGTIKMQQPFFKLQGLDFDAYFGGDYVSATLNISIAPLVFEIKKPEYFFPNIKWTDVFPAENFFLSEAQVVYRDAVYKALIYIPDPATKPDHFKQNTVIEVISQKIKDIQYGDCLKLRFNPEAISVKAGE